GIKLKTNDKSNELATKKGRKIINKQAINDKNQNGEGAKALPHFVNSPLIRGFLCFNRCTEYGRRVSMSKNIYTEFQIKELEKNPNASERSISYSPEFKTKTV
ncbi:hypothetical protein, partial [Peribacillus sp. YIM B13482]|uniref:hypothetical protein n=1 Tax=Peribacillus sp. YIM B13482 TaxID=3366298 RepID=UPI00366B2D48